MTVPTLPKLREDLILRQVEEDFVVYDPVSDHTALLNLSAAMALDLCDGTRTASEITAEVARAFGVDEGRVAEDLEAAFKEFAEHRFFAAADEGESTQDDASS